jgi:type IV pilus assembly protein PilM
VIKLDCRDAENNAVPSLKAPKLTLTKPKKSAPVGVDLDDRSIAATAVVDGRVTTANAGVGALAPGAISEGEVTDVHAVAAALRQLFSTHGLPKQVRLAVANQRVAFRTIRLPMIENPDHMKAAVRFQAQAEIPMPLESAVLDHQVIGTVSGEDGNRQLEVAVVAARKETIAPILDAARRAGLDPVGIDLASFGMIRALAADGNVASTDVAAQGYLEATLFCNLGDRTNLAIGRGRACVFSRVAQFGLADVVRELSVDAGLTPEHAEQWLVYTGLSTPIEELEGDPGVLARVRDALLSGAGRLADELRLSLDYYGGQEGATPVDNILLCGWGSAIPGLPDALGDELGRRVSTVVPAAVAAAGFDPVSAARLTLSYGLALEQ